MITLSLRRKPKHDGRRPRRPVLTPAEAAGFADQFNDRDIADALRDVPGEPATWTAPSASWAGVHEAVLPGSDHPGPHPAYRYPEVPEVSHEQRAASAVFDTAPFRADSWLMDEADRWAAIARGYVPPPASAAPPAPLTRIADPELIDAGMEPFFAAMIAGRMRHPGSPAGTRCGPCGYRPHGVTGALRDTDLTAHVVAELYARDVARYDWRPAAAPRTELGRAA